MWYRSVTNPSRVRASASMRPLQLVPGIRGEHQSRSVGPLPATKTTPGCGPVPAGLVRVPYTGIPSTSQAISSDVTVMTHSWRENGIIPAGGVRGAMSDGRHERLRRKSMFDGSTTPAPAGSTSPTPAPRSMRCDSGLSGIRRMTIMNGRAKLEEPGPTEVEIAPTARECDARRVVSGRTGDGGRGHISASSWHPRIGSSR